MVSFGGTVFGWHNTPGGYGGGDFSVGNNVLQATEVDPTTDLTPRGALARNRGGYI